MQIFRILVSILMIFFATVIMSYISMAIPIGPWIESTIVLLTMLIFSLFSNHFSEKSKIEGMGLATVAAGIGGILATGMAFSFPTIYFVDRNLFMSWIEKPFYFASIMALISISAGGIGIAIANFFEKKLLIDEKMPFPIGELINKVLVAQNKMGQAIQLFIGFVTTTVLLILQKITGFISQNIILINKFSWNFFNFPKIGINTELIYMFLAVGFVTGHVIALPLLVGFLTKICVIDVVYYFYRQSPSISKCVSAEDFSVAFSTGMILYGVIISFLGLPKNLKAIFAKFKNNSIQSNQIDIFKYISISGFISLILSIIFLTYFKFSIISQIFILLSLFLWTYQVLVIAGKIGMAPLGRFATFIMVPGMILFGFTGVQAALVATFVEICVGVSADTLFGRRMGRLTDIDHKKVEQYQWLGLIISSLFIGGIFWLFIKHFGIGGTTDLPVFKAYSRSLLISCTNFDFLTLLFGLIFGWLLSFTKISPALMLGGILMPPQYSLMLIFGGFSTYLFKDRQYYYPFWSGVFAANSIWMLLKIFIK